MDELGESIQRWLEKNMQFIEFVVPVENSLTTDPVQAMFCGTVERMKEALAAISASGMKTDISVSKTEYPERDLCHCGRPERSACSKGTRSNDGPTRRHPPRTGHGHR